MTPPRKAGEAIRIRTLIADDEPLARRGVRLLLERDPDIEIVGEATGGVEAADLITRLKPDLVFLDVQMVGCDGFETLMRVGPEAAPVVVFVTAYDEYALRAFEFNAVDYLLKPYDDVRFAAALDRARELVVRKRGDAVDNRLTRLIEHLEGESRDRILLKSSGEIIFLKTSEVDWIEAEGDYVKFHVAGRAHLMRGTMAALEERLDPSRFIRIHRSTIVNIDRLRKLSPSFEGEYAVVLHDGTKLRLSRGYHDRITSLLGSVELPPVGRAAGSAALIGRPVSFPKPARPARLFTGACAPCSFFSSCLAGAASSRASVDAVPIGLSDARAARDMLGGVTWARIMRIDNSRPIGMWRCGAYPATVYGLVFELSGILWLYTDSDGTQSLSLTTGTLDKDKANPGPLLLAIDRGFRKWAWLDDTAGAGADLGRRPPNACMPGSVAALLKRLAVGGETGSPRLLFYYVKAGGARHGHTVLLFSAGGHLSAVDAEASERPVSLPDSLGADPRSISAYLRGGPVVAARTLPIQCTGSLAPPRQWAAQAPPATPAG